MIRFLQNWFLKSCLKLIAPDDILRFDGKHFWLGKTKLTEAKGNTLLSEAQALSHYELPTHLFSQVRAEAAKQLFEKATSPEELWFAKGMYYAVQLLEDKIRNLTKIQ